MKYIKNLLLVLTLWVTGCTVYTPDPFVPYKAYDYPPPVVSGRKDHPTSLRCIDNSNIFVHCNEAWWWAGPSRGWVPTGGGMFPWPRQVWPNKVQELFAPWEINGKPVPVVLYPY